MFLVIFKCLVHLIETSETVPAPKPERIAWDYKWCEAATQTEGRPQESGWGTPTSSSCTQSCLIFSLCLEVKGPRSSNRPRSPPCWKQAHSSLHLEGRIAHIWKSDNIRGWGRQVFHFSSRCLATVLRKGLGRVHRERPEIQQKKRPARGGTQKRPLGSPKVGPAHPPNTPL